MHFELKPEQCRILCENAKLCRLSKHVFPVRCIPLSVWKKQRWTLHAAQADTNALVPVIECYKFDRVEGEYARYSEAVKTLENPGIPRECLIMEQAALYEKLAEINHSIHAEQKKMKLCKDIIKGLPHIGRDIDRIERENGKRSEKADSGNTESGARIGLYHLVQPDTTEHL